MSKSKENDISKEIVPQAQNFDDSLQGFLNSDIISPTRASALITILKGKIPKEAIRKHPGAGGKTFSYVDHVWVTKKLRQAFGATWSFEASEATIEEDGTASARGTLRVKFPDINNNGWIEMVFSDYGACQTTKGMTMANRKLAAASKALVRCAFRAFGIGEEFYDSSADDALTNKGAWDMFETQVLNNKKYISMEDLIGYCQNNGITKTDLVDRFDEIWGFIYDTIHTRKLQEQE